MTFDDFQKILADWNLFPADILADAQRVASSLNEEQREALCSDLKGIHQSCAELEHKESEKFAEAVKELDALRRKYLPEIHQEIEDEERAEATKKISEQFDV